VDQILPPHDEDRSRVAGLKRRAHALLGGGDLAVARRMASATFLLRVANAGLALVLQVALARWMGVHEYGLYAYAWVWVLLLSGLGGAGLASASQRLLPEYRQRDDLPRLRGFLLGGSLISFGISGVLAGLAGLWVVYGPGIHPDLRLPLLVACACVPFFVALDFGEGVARAYHWALTAFMPAYFFQPLIILLIAGGAFLAGVLLDAALLMWISLGSIIACWLGQLVLVRRRLRSGVPAGPRLFDTRRWMAVAWPLLMLDGCYLLLTYVDVLVLERFEPPEEVARYYAATKIMAVMSFVAFAVQAASAARFAEYHARGDHAALERFARTAARWMLWPSCAAAAVLLGLGEFLLGLFGETFEQAYILLPLLGTGLLARAAAGPAEQLLAMTGHERAGAWIAGAALLVNLVLNLLLVPVIGAIGAAIGTSIALAAQAILLMALAKRRLGIR
jgi:O-antigen/teichoic acid export membrane protein